VWGGICLHPSLGKGEVPRYFLAAVCWIYRPVLWWRSSICSILLRNPLQNVVVYGGFTISSPRHKAKRMLNRVWVCLISLLLSLSPSFSESSFAKSRLPKVRIGIITDGPYQDYGWGKVVKSKLFLKEILELTRGEFDVIFPKNRWVMTS